MLYTALYTGGIVCFNRSGRRMKEQRQFGNATYRFLRGEGDGREEYSPQLRQNKEISEEQGTEQE